MIGRETQLQTLEDHLHEVLTGSGRLVFVAGEAGIGKTRLVRAFLERAADSTGVVALQGTCDEYSLAIPYGPFLGALRALLREQPPEALVQAAGPLSSELLPLLPELGPLPAPSTLPGDPLGQKQRLVEALYRVLRPWTDGQCRILVLEDLHWSDQTSLEVLRYLARAAARDGLLILCTYRADELHRRHPLTHLLAQCRRDRLSHEVHVPPLSQAELARMLEATLGRAVPAAFVTLLLDRTGGNAFYVEEILGTLLDQDRLDAMIQAAQKQRSSDLLTIPPSIRDSIRSRTAGLDGVTRDVLMYAAVLGRRFEFDLLQQLTGLTETALVRAIERLIDLHMVVEESAAHEDRYSFRHALSREAVHADLLGRDRRRMHRAILSVLETMHGSDSETVLDQLAYHSLQGGVLPSAARYARLAGERSARMLAFREARAYYETALELQETAVPSERAGLLLCLADAAYPLGDVDVYERCWREALQLYKQLEDRFNSAVILRRIGMSCRDRGDYEQYVTHVHAAIAILEALPHQVELAAAYNDLANYYRINRIKGLPRTSIEWAEKALQLANGADGVRVRADALINIANALADLGEPRRAVEYLERSIALARDADLVKEMLRANMHLQTVLGEYLGEFRRAAAVYVEGMAAAGQVGWEVRMGGDCADTGGMALMQLGHWEQAHEALDRGFRAAEMGHPFSRMIAAPYKAALLLRQGRIDEARTLLVEVLPALEARSEYEQVLVFPIHSQILLASGDQAGALRAIDRAIAMWRSLGSPAWGVGLLGDAIGLYFGLGRENQANELLPELVAMAENAAASTAPAIAAGALGHGANADGRYAAASEYFLQAARAWQAVEAPYQEVRSRRLRAESLLQSGNRSRRGEAREELAAAQSICARLGAGLELAGIAATQRRYGIAAPLHQVTGKHASGLTRREREVIALIGQGYSNRDIAAALVITVKTVETHVGNIFGKLNCTSRTQVAAYAVKHGLVSAGTS